MKFGIQKFLNPADSNDSGYLKLSIRPREGMRRGTQSNAGHSVTYQLADCSDRIYLDFSYGGSVDFESFSTSTEEVKRMKRSMNKRRRKMQLFVDAINKFADKYFEAMDEDEAVMDDYLAKVKGVEGARKRAKAEAEKKARNARYVKANELYRRTVDGTA